MPTYPIKPCPSCGGTEVFARMADAGSLRCCGNFVKQDYGAKCRTVQYQGDEWHNMARRELLTEGVSPADAPAKAAELASYGLSHVYQKNGDCVVNSKAEMKRLAAAKKDINARKHAAD